MDKTINWEEFQLSGPNGLLALFKQVKDPRSRFGKSLDLAGLLALSFCAVVCGCNSYEAISDWGKALDQSELNLFGLRRPPSTSLYQKTFRLLNCAAIEALVMKWLLGQEEKIIDRVLSFDGKTNRGSKTAGNKGIHLLTAICQESNEILFQKKVGQKTNEIPELRTMLREMDITDSVITADAAHTQVSTAEVIVNECSSDYVFSVKDNQSDLKKNWKKSISHHLHAITLL